MPNIILTDAKPSFPSLVLSLDDLTAAGKGALGGTPKEDSTDDEMDSLGIGLVEAQASLRG